MIGRGAIRLTIPTALLIAGCIPESTRFKELHRELGDLRAENRRLEETVDARDRQIEALEGVVDQLHDLGDSRIDKLYHVERVQIGRLSGGRDFDDSKPGDDGVTVYLKLFDQDGHVFKAAGKIEVRVFDLEGSEQGERVARCEYDVDATREMWFGRLMTYHYRIDCPWSKEPPQGREVTVKVTFVDYLTGACLVDTRQVEVRPPARAAAIPAGGSQEPNDR